MPLTLDLRLVAIGKIKVISFLNIFFYRQNKNSLIKRTIDLLREEKRSQITMEGAKEKEERVQPFLAQVAIRNRKETQTGEKSPIRLSKTRLFLSFQIAQMMPCRHNFQNLHEFLPGDIALQEEKRSINVARIVILRLTN